MANYKKYPILGASNYTVNKIGEVFNRHGKKLSPRKDGRYEIRNDTGHVILITSGVEYLRSIYDASGYPGRYSMMSHFPRYMVDRDANIFHVLRPYEPINTDTSEGVQIANEYGKFVRINRFRALAVYGFKQRDTGYVRIIDTIYDGEEGIDISDEPLSNERVKMIHPSLMNVKVELLEHHNIAVCYSPDGKAFVLKQWDTGHPVAYIEKEYKGRIVPHYIAPTRRISWQSTISGKKPIYGKMEICFAPLEVLLQDPNRASTNRILMKKYTVTLKELYELDLK